jgi:hypothetical protein
VSDYTATDANHEVDMVSNLYLIKVTISTDFNFQSATINSNQLYNNHLGGGTIFPAKATVSGNAIEIVFTLRADSGAEGPGFDTILDLKSCVEPVSADAFTVNWDDEFWVKELAVDLGMTEDEVVHQIIEWYFIDNPD